MSGMIPAFLILSLTIMAISIWMIVANNRTLRDKLSMLPAPGDPLFRHKMAALQEVSYGRHLMAVVLFQNWTKLYDPIVFTTAEQGNHTHEH